MNRKEGACPAERPVKPRSSGGGEIGEGGSAEVENRIALYVVVMLIR